MTLLPTRRFRPRRLKPGGLGSWTGHLPFINELVSAFQPSRFVELGTHYGESYFGICQAIEENGVDCQCVAVDTWLGDIHSGLYDEAVFEEVKEYNSLYYREFSSLLRCTFDEAVSKFVDESIDLLHIDGLHTYEAVKRDFENWFPKVRPGGIILLHDTEARHAEFAVWKYWEELARTFPHFEFVHSWGLGLVRKDGEGRPESDFIAQLWSSSPETRSFIRHYYSLQADALEASQGSRATETEPGANVLVQAYPCLDHGYSEGNAASQYMRSGVWQVLNLELPRGSPAGPIRIDPSDRPAVVAITGIRVRRSIDLSILKSWNDPQTLIAPQRSQGIVPLPSADGTRFLTVSADPQFFLPALDAATGDQPLRLEISMRLDTDIADTIGNLRVSAAEAAHREFLIAISAELSQAGIAVEAGPAASAPLENSIHLLRAGLHRIMRERPISEPRGTAEMALDLSPVLGSFRSSLQLSAAERNRIQNEADLASSEAAKLRAKLLALETAQISQRAELLQHRAKIVGLTTQVDELRTQLDQHRGKNAEMALDLAYSRAEAERLRQTVAALLKSYSWKTTAPLRKVFDVLARVQNGNRNTQATEL